MILKDILFEVGELRSPGGDRLRSDYKRMVNRAQRTIAGRRDWSFMFNNVQATLPRGQTSVALPFDFKELAAEQTPVSYNQPTNGFPVPVTVTSRAEVQRIGNDRAYDYVVVPGSYLPIKYVFFEHNGPGGSRTLNVPPQYTPDSDTVFNISAYWYPSDLVQAADHNWLTDDPELADALISLTRYLCYNAEDPTDPRAVACKDEYEKRIKVAAINDARKKISGRAMRW